eukprot:symbB.v1.2.009638.t1/scaffold617.1/size180324/4
MAARRNKVCLSTEKLNQWEWLESKIRSKVQKHRVNLLPSFKDMDRSNCGHITKNQFFRDGAAWRTIQGEKPLQHAVRGGLCVPCGKTSAGTFGY